MNMSASDSTNTTNFALPTDLKGHGIVQIVTIIAWLIMMKTGNVPLSKKTATILVVISALCASSMTRVIVGNYIMWALIVMVYQKPCNNMEQVTIYCTYPSIQPVYLNLMMFLDYVGYINLVGLLVAILWFIAVKYTTSSTNVDVSSPSSPVQSVVDVPSEPLAKSSIGAVPSKTISKTTAKQNIGGVVAHHVNKITINNYQDSDSDTDSDSDLEDI